MRLLFAILLVSIFTVAIIYCNKYRKRLKSIISIRESISLVNMPVITFTQGITKLKFLLDSGSDINVICKDSLDKIHSTIADSGNPVEISGVSGSHNSECGVIVPFTYDTLKFDALFFPVGRMDAFNDIESKTGVKIDGILGTPFMVKYKYIIDFNKLKVEVK